jgi:XisH protein
MAAKDKFHEAVKKGLEKDGWFITHDPLKVKYGEIKMQIDLGAQQLLAAIKGTEKIAIEIKSFLSLSFINDFYNALGQFLSYKIALELQEPDRKLYLAVPHETFDEFFVLDFTQTAIKRYDLKIIVYEPAKEEIIQWIS